MFWSGTPRHPPGQGTPRDCVLSMHSMGSAPDLPLLDLLNAPTISALLRCSQSPLKMGTAHQSLCLPQPHQGTFTSLTLLAFLGPAHSPSQSHKKKELLVSSSQLGQNWEVQSRAEPTQRAPTPSQLRGCHSPVGQRLWVSMGHVTHRESGNGLGWKRP